MITHIQIRKGSTINGLNYFDKAVSADACIANVKIFQLRVAYSTLVSTDYFEQWVDGLLLKKKSISDLYKFKLALEA